LGFVAVARAARADVRGIVSFIVVDGVFRCWRVILGMIDGLFRFEFDVAKILSDNSKLEKDNIVTYLRWLNTTIESLG
jgi:hypothetical protein